MTPRRRAELRAMAESWSDWQARCPRCGETQRMTLEQARRGLCSDCAAKEHAISGLRRLFAWLLGGVFRAAR